MSTVAARREAELEDLCGLSAVIAVERLRSAELRPAIESLEVDDAAQHGLVIAQIPDAPSRVRRAQLITLIVGQSTVRQHAASLTEAGVAARRIQMTAIAPAVSASPPADTVRDDDPGRQPAPRRSSGASAEQTAENEVTPHPGQPFPDARPIAAALGDRDRAPSVTSQRSATRRNRRRLTWVLVAVAVASIAATVALTYPARPPATRLSHPAPPAPITAVAPPLSGRRRPHPHATAPPASAVHQAAHRHIPAGSARAQATTATGWRRPGSFTAPNLRSSPAVRPATPATNDQRPIRASGPLPPSPTGPLPGPYPNQP